MIRKVVITLPAVMAVVTVLAWIGSFVPRSSESGIVLDKGWWTGWIYADPRRAWVAGHAGHLSMGMISRGTTMPIGGPIPTPQQFEYAGVKYLARVGISDVEYELAVPFWVVTILFATYPTITFIRGPLRRWRRRRRGECVNCGYNLTGNVTGVCSECGAAIESA